MHPNPLFRSDDRAMMLDLVNQITVGMVFLTTPDGPRVAHTPLIADDTGTVRFHLSRGNALTPHLDGATALITANGPHGYVSPRWYDDRNTVPTWDYVALELEGPVRMLSTEELDGFLYQLVDRQETALGGDQPALLIETQGVATDGAGLGQFSDTHGGSQECLTLEHTPGFSLHAP